MAEKGLGSVMDGELELSAFVVYEMLFTVTFRTKM